MLAIDEKRLRKKAQQRAWREANKARLAEYKRAHYADPVNKARKQETDRAYRESHKEQRRAYDAARTTPRAVNKERVRQTARDRYARQRAAYLAARADRAAQTAERVVENGRTRAQEWYADNKDRARASARFKKYGLTQEQFDAMFAEQGRACGLCGAKEPGNRRTGWHVDHDHRTGKVRGILCHHCNTGLGKFKDDPDLLRRAACYVSQKADSDG
jgi:hypothetical protein